MSNKKTRVTFTQQQTQIIYQCYQKGYQYNQIAQGLNVPVKAIEKCCEAGINVGILVKNDNIISTKGKKGSKKSKNGVSLMQPPQFNFTNPESTFNPVLGITQNTPQTILPKSKKSESSSKKQQVIIEFLIKTYELQVKNHQEVMAVLMELYKNIKK
jgi:hypothetical protein